ncbi:MAG: hypothetical protein M1823_003620 [Watsoniomyces obsoletus]|nr:MAG: hypothetical protein M1823_003620 [Watsoniomyces obsoletus]
MALSVSGKVAIVAGGGSGISLAFARQLLSENCSVIIADLSLRPEASELVSQYADKRTADRPQALFQQTDVTSWKQLSALFMTASQEFGGADIAGVFEPPFSNFWAPPSEKDAEAMDESRYKTLDINLAHPIRCTQLAIAHFLARYPADSPLPPGLHSRGVVIHVSSAAAQEAALNVPLYDASKAGLSHFVRALGALEPRLGIRVNAVAPGLIKTPLWTDHPEKLKLVDETVNEWVMPEEVARAMLDCVQSVDENVGGTIWEVGRNRTRKVEVFHDPGPSSPEFSSAGIRSAYEDVFQTLKKPGWGK